MHHRRRGRLGLMAAMTVAVLVSCGGSDAADTGTVDTGTVEASDTAGGDDATTGTAAVDTAGGDESTVLTGEQICQRLTIASVAADVGLDIVAAEPDDTTTPQCAYEYTTDSGGRSNLTVAAMRPSDVGGAVGSDAFAYVAGVNMSIAGDGAEQQEIDAGDEALRISGAALHLGILRIGDHVYTLIVPVDDAGIDAIDHLISTMATTLG